GARPGIHLRRTIAAAAVPAERNPWACLANGVPAPRCLARAIRPHDTLLSAERQTWDIVTGRFPVQEDEDSEGSGMSDRAVAAPSSFNQHIFFSPESVYYGTDDGYQDGSLTELVDLQRFHERVAPARRDRIHFVSAVGGLYGLNVMTCWQPREITFFDI